jgi:HPt (histidine-containing phosphotransfer) domain-containing protein
MKKTLSKIIGSSIIASLLIVPMVSVRAELDKENWEGRNIPTPTLFQIKEGEREVVKNRLENRAEIMKIRIERPLLKASTTEKRLENRENNIERIRERIASTTASTSVKRMENLDKRFEKQVEMMGKVKERLLEKEMKVTEVLGKIADKIQERIDILTGKGLDMTAANTKLSEAAVKLEAITVEGDNLATLIETEITDTNKETLFTSIKASQDKIKTLAKETHALLVEAVKGMTN